MIESKYPKLQEACKHLSPVGAIINSKDCIYIIFEGEIPGESHGSGVASYYPKMDGVWALQQFGGFKNLQGAVSNDGRLIVCSSDGTALGQPKNYDNTTKPEFLFEFPIASTRINLTRVRTIAGIVYIVTKGQAVYKRTGLEDWKCLLKNTPIKKIGKYGGFTDIDGLSEDDLYACGGQGVLWHFNGTDWHVNSQLQGLASENDLYFQTISCRADGSVYIGCRKGEIICGIDGKWTILKDKAPSKIIDMISYKNKLYIACGKKGLLTYDGISLTPLHANIDDGETLNSANTLSTDGNILVVTGKNKVHTFDGSDWVELYAPKLIS